MEDQVLTGHKPVPMKIANKVMKSICKIIIRKEGKPHSFGTGFFLKVSDSLKCLVTNYHVLNPELFNIKLEIEIWNENKVFLDIHNLFIKYFPKPKDITVIELKNINGLYKDILFLDFDVNYITKGYNIYKDADVFSIHHPFGDDAACASGKIVEIKDYEFYHKIPTEHGSSGCPIILLNNNINFIQVIGIHKKGDNNKGINGGTFIGEIINEIYYDLKGKLNDNSLRKINNENISKDSDIILKNEKNDYIIADIYINDTVKSKYIQLINSYEQCIRRELLYLERDERYKNEEEIKECDIIIKNAIIPFRYNIKLTSDSESGLYKIKYIFKKEITKTNNMFYDCDLLKSIDFSHFKFKNLFFMNNMFYNCASLISINLSNCNTQNVIDMHNMFNGCKSLISLNLSNFNTENVTDMRYMFNNCKSLTSINLSNFNTRNVTDMCGMFKGCSSLISLDVSNFDTKKVEDMTDMFNGCKSLRNLNLSSFNTLNVESMSEIFNECSALRSLDLSNFNTKKTEQLDDMFKDCYSLKLENIIVYDHRIKGEFNKISRLLKENIGECYNN